MKPGLRNWLPRRRRPAWLDPQLLSTVLSLGKTLGPRRTAWIGLVGAFAVGLLLSRGADKR